MFLGEIFSMDIVIVIVVVAVLVFGGSAIPKLARNLGSAKTEFEKGLKAAKSTDETDAKSTEVKSTEADK